MEAGTHHRIPGNTLHVAGWLPVPFSYEELLGNLLLSNHGAIVMRDALDSVQVASMESYPVKSLDDVHQLHWGTAWVCPPACTRSRWSFSGSCAAMRGVAQVHIM